MLTRKEQDHSPKHLDQAWIHKLEILLREAYDAYCEEEAKAFEVYTEVYANEFLLTISFKDKNNEALIPVTFFLSTDLDEKTKMAELLQKSLDASSMLIENFFNNGEVFTGRWQEEDFQQQIFFYKITRENIALTLKANALLASH